MIVPRPVRSLHRPQRVARFTLDSCECYIYAIVRHARKLLPVLALFLLVLPLAAQNPMEEIGREEFVSIQGTLRDAATGREVPDIRVDLSSLSGGTVDSTVTSSSGGFFFDNVTKGSYVIAVQHPDYLPLSQQVISEGRRIFGLQLSLRKKPGAAGTPAANPDPGASARATGIPRAAQEAMNRGMDLLYVKSDIRGSLSQFERAIKAYAGFYEAYTQMGVAHTNLGDSADAEKVFRKAIELSQEKYVDAYAGLAVVLSNVQRYADAEVAARKAVELNPSDWRGQGELGRALFSLQRYQDAEAPASAAAKLAPDNPTLQLLRAGIHLQLNKFPAVVEDLDAYLKLVPTGPEADRMRDLRARVLQAIAGAPPSPQSPRPAP